MRLGVLVPIKDDIEYKQLCDAVGYHKYLMFFHDVGHAVVDVYSSRVATASVQNYQWCQHRVTDRELFTHNKITFSLSEFLNLWAAYKLTGNQEVFLCV